MTEDARALRARLQKAIDDQNKVGIDVDLQLLRDCLAALAETSPSASPTATVVGALSSGDGHSLSDSRQAQEALAPPSAGWQPIATAFLKALRPIERSAAWAREHSAKSPSSHQEFIREADENWAAFEKAKVALVSLLPPAPSSEGR